MIRNLESNNPGNGELAKDAVLEGIGQRYRKSAAQVALRYILQRNATITTQSTKRSHLDEDMGLFDFALSAEEMKQLDGHTESVFIA